MWASTPIERVGYDPTACFCPIPSFPLDVFKSYLYMLTPGRELVQVKCCSLLPVCSGPASDPQAHREQQHRHQQWDKEGGRQSATGKGTSVFSSSTDLCWFKMAVKLWKTFHCLQCRIIMAKEIRQSSNFFFHQKLFCSGVIDATVRIKLEGSNWKLFLGCFLEHKLSTRWSC